MKIHIPNIRRPIAASLRSIKKLDKGGIRIKVSAWSYSTDDNFYLVFDKEEAKQIFDFLEEKVKCG